MGNLRANWAKSFANTNRELWLLEETPEIDLKLFETKDKISADESAWWEHREPSYHVWLGDKWLYCGPDFHAAQAKYRQLRDGGDADE